MKIKIVYDFYKKDMFKFDDFIKILEKETKEDFNDGDLEHVLREVLEDNYNNFEIFRFTEEDKKDIEKEVICTAIDNYISEYCTIKEFEI